MELFRKSAESFEKLLRTEYLLRYQQRGEIISLNLTFNKDHFKHLSGVNKLKDISLPQKASILYNHALNGMICTDNLRSSRFYDEAKIEGRLRALTDLPRALEDPQYIYIFNTASYRKNFGETKIEAEYFFKFYNETFPEMASYYFYFIRSANEPKIFITIVPYPFLKMSARWSEVRKNLKYFILNKTVRQQKE